jgi:WD40 repeat protein
MRFLVLVVFAVLSVSDVGAQAELPPYIHYFDHLRGGLVIERADGTDSRMIPDVLMDAGPPVWSASGKWMVIGQEILSTDGKQRTPYPAVQGEISSIGEQRWSPTDDVLLIAAIDLRLGTLDAHLYDVETRLPLARFTFEGFNTDINRILTYWTADGSRAYIYAARMLITLERDGVVTLRDNNNVYPVLQSGFRNGRTWKLSRAAHNRLNLQIDSVEDPQQIVVENLIRAGYYSYGVAWSPTLDHALLYAKTCYGCDISWLKLVDWKAGTIRTVSLPLKLRDSNFACVYDEDYLCKDLWSPDGRYAVLIGEDERLYLLDTVSAAIHQISTRAIFYFQWSAAGQLFTMPYDDWRLHRYDPASRTEYITETPLSNYGLFPSPDGAYVAVAADPATIMNENGAVVRQSPMHSLSMRANCCPHYFDWHPDGRWVMAAYLISFGGPSAGPDAKVLIDINGTTRRELPYDGLSGFVPDHAVLHLSPGEPVSAKKEPALLLPQEESYQAVGWHPTDPDRLVTYSRESDALTFWSLANGQPQVTSIADVTIVPLRPFGGLLYWMPDQNAVAFYHEENLLLWQVDLTTGDTVSGIALDFPVLTNIDGVPTIQYPASGKVITVGTDLGEPWYARPTSDLSAFIVMGRTNDLPIYYYVDAVTGEVTTFDQSFHLTFDPLAWDASHGIAVLGSVFHCCVAVMSTEDGHVIDKFYATPSGLAISADGRRLATTSEGMTAIWDISEYMGEE